MFRQTREALTWYADKCMESALDISDDRGVSLSYALCGLGLYRLGEGRYHNYVEAVDALYRYIRSHPDRDLTGTLFNAFDLVATEYPVTLHSLYISLGILKYQNLNQLAHTSPFTVDVESLMKKLNETIDRDEELKHSTEAREMVNEFAQAIREDTLKGQDR